MSNEIHLFSIPSLQADTISGDKLGTFSQSAHFQSVTQRVRESRLAQQAERHRVRKQQAKQAAALAAAQAAALAAREAEKRWEAEEAERRPSSARGSGLQGAAQGSTSATKAIQKELAKMFALQTGAKGKSSLPAGGFEVELPEEENLYRWRVKLRPSLFAGSTLEAVRVGLAWPCGRCLYRHFCGHCLRGIVILLTHPRLVIHWDGRGEGKRRQ
jgi:hypothetical protein